jgi:ribosomal protein L16/L10AE
MARAGKGAGSEDDAAAERTAMELEVLKLVWAHTRGLEEARAVAMEFLAAHCRAIWVRAGCALCIDF